MGSILSRRITYEKRQAGKKGFRGVRSLESCQDLSRVASGRPVKVEGHVKANRDLSSLVSRENRQPRTQGICNFLLEGSLSVLQESNRRYRVVVCSRREPFGPAQLQFIAIEEHDNQQV